MTEASQLPPEQDGSQEGPIDQSQADRRQKADRLAFLSVILGLVSLVPQLLAVAWVLGIVMIMGWACAVVSLGAAIVGILALVRKTRHRKIALAGICASIVGIMLFYSALTMARERIMRAICGANFHSIGQAVALYQRDNKAEFPPTLQHLIDAGQGERAFTCPSTRHEKPFDYFYLPPTMDAHWDTIIACDFEANHRDIRNVLFADSHVRAMEIEEFEQELAKPHNAAFAAALREAERGRGDSKNP
jgi:prepilin-type processing-associated H-X9-DG protein